MGLAYVDEHASAIARRLFRTRLSNPTSAKFQILIWMMILIVGNIAVYVVYPYTKIDREQFSFNSGEQSFDSVARVGLQLEMFANMGLL